MKRLYFDMDGVLVDFQSGLAQQDEKTLREYEGREDEIPGIFGVMKPIDGAIEAVHSLSKHYDCYILSTAPWRNPSAWSDKVAWVTKYLDDIFHKRIIITHCKHLCKGDYLIDDNPEFIIDKRDKSKKIIVDTPYNRNVSKKYKRVNSLKDAVVYIINNRKKNKEAA
jgi:5'(3')-deoxyribonucleotidase